MTDAVEHHTLREALHAFHHLFSALDRSAFLRPGTEYPEETGTVSHWQILEAGLRAREVGGDVVDAHRLRLLLWEQVAKLLAAGTLVATGIAPAAIRTEIDGFVASDAEPDFDKSILHSNEVTYTGVRLSPAHRIHPVTVSQRQTPATWMLEATAAGIIKRGDAIPQCREATGCLWRDAEAAWNALPEGRRRRRGRPGKSSE